MSMPVVPAAPAAELVERLARAGALSALDRHLGRAVSALDGADALVALCAALASRAVQLGHVCVDLSALDLAALASQAASEQTSEPLPWPSAEQLHAALQASPLCTQLGADDADANVPTPLVLDGQRRLYLQRYARYERTLAAVLLARARRVGDVDLELLREGVRRLFPEPAEGRAPDVPPGDARGKTSHALVACVAALHALAVICGGPGTGKTTTVVKILALLQEQALARDGRALTILLLAPTGKAARRLAASVQTGLRSLPVSDAVKATIPSEAYTIHRALGGSSGHFRHGEDNPLPADVVLVDEVSMVDLALLYRLSIAIRPQARLILQGDKDQLASVEAGAILGDIYDPRAAAGWSLAFAGEVLQITGQALEAEHSERGLWDCLVSLDESYRYRADSGIGQLARAINAGNAAAALGCLRRRSSLDTAERDAELFEPHEASLSEPGGELERRATVGYAPFIQATDPQAKLELLGNYRVLCAHRQGLRGVEQQNRNVEEWLARAGLIETGAVFYENRPIIITQNDYTLALFNGDVGVVVRDEHGRLRVCFEAADGLRFLATGRLPPHETVFATTVHKSQGSEFDAVSLVLPDTVSPLVGRELLYTAVTRARRRVDVFGPADVIVAAIARTVQRPSGLSHTLWRR